MLNQNQVEQYRDDGFLILADFFSEAELETVETEIDALVETLAVKLDKRGKLKDLHRDKGFRARLTAIEKDCPGASVKLHTQGILSPEVARLWSSKKLLDVVEPLIGPDIVGHPVWNLRSKTPLNPLATVPWHQDCAYLSTESQQTLQPTAWIPLVDANRENGCLQLIRGVHSDEYKHRMEHETGHKNSWYLLIEEQDLPEGEVITCEMKRGSLLLLNQLIPHRSTENYSDIVRWSLDFRWQNPAFPAGVGNKLCIPMRKSDDPTFIQQWDSLEVMNRHGTHSEPGTEIDQSWMKRWEKK